MKTTKSIKAESALSKPRIISELTRSPHGALAEYLPIGLKAAEEDPNFFAHLLAWNQHKGQVRDAKVALPLISLAKSGADLEVQENAMAHLARLGPREYLRAMRFVKEQKGVMSGIGTKLRNLTKRYLHYTEQDFQSWSRMAVLHHKTLKELYALYHVKPKFPGTGRILFNRDVPSHSVFAALKSLATAEPSEAAGIILNWKLPFLVVRGALGVKVKHPDVMLALVQRMSPTELVTNVNALNKWGMQSHAAVRGAYEKALEQTQKSTKNVLKTSRAADAMQAAGMDASAAKLRNVQEAQLNKLSVDGDWLVLADKSGSMSGAIEAARTVAGTLSRLVKGKVHLVFFDTGAEYHDVTGKTYEEIKVITGKIRANGGTSIGVGLDYAVQRNLDFDGIAVVSDGAEHSPPYFMNVYDRLCAARDGNVVPVYHYDVDGEPNTFGTDMGENGHAVQTFDLRGKALDFYSLPNLVQTMRVNPYSLVDEIMAYPLLTFADVFREKNNQYTVGEEQSGLVTEKGEEVHV